MSKKKDKAERPLIRVSSHVLGTDPTAKWPENLPLCGPCSASTCLVCVDNKGWAPGEPLLCGCSSKLHVDHWDETGFRALAGQVRA